MALQIFNTLTKQKELFTPPDDNTIKMYSCGVTVYDKCHIGHARSLYIFDVIRKYLKHRGYGVKFVRNITDVDDKIINKANELGKPFEQVVKENIDAYYKDLKSLGVDKADEEPRATEHIPEMILHIKGLIEKDLAYESDGDVYFKVRGFKDYGKLSGQSPEHMLEAVRIETGDKKQDPLDFALWKKAKDGEPFWESPWGRGRPGWHIECSCMSMKCLDTETLDIHAGGRDLVFPHHENEIAQSEGLTGKPFAKHWIHHGLLTINGQKMAKSLGNFITVDDALAKYSVDQLKLLFLSSHYSSPVDFTDDKMQEAKKTLTRFQVCFTRVDRLEKAQLKESQLHQGLVEDFNKAMDDDFNTSEALAVCFNYLNIINKSLDSGGVYEDVIAIKYTLEVLLRDILGLFKGSVDNADIDQEIREMLQKRVEARINKDFAESDQMRDALKLKGIIVEDGKDGQTWRRA